MRRTRRAIASVAGLVAMTVTLGVGPAWGAAGDPVHFNPGLQTCVNLALNQQPGAAITEAQAATVKVLNCQNGSFTNLDGVESLTSLERIDLSNGAVLDLSPLLDPRLTALVRVTALDMHQDLPPIPVFAWQPNVISAPGVDARIFVPFFDQNLTDIGEFDGPRDHWRFIDAHAANPGELTLGWHVHNFFSPQRVKYEFSGSVSQTAYWQAPMVETQPTSVSTVEWSPVSFTATATSNQQPSIQWQVSETPGVWTDLPGENNEVLSLDAVYRYMNQWEYRAVFTNSAGTAVSDPAVLEVARPVSILRDPAEIYVSEGGSGSTDATFLSDAANPVYRWEVSTDGGMNWNNITDQNVLQSSLIDLGWGEWFAEVSVSSATKAMNNWRVRLVLWDDVAKSEVVSWPASITVTSSSSSIPPSVPSP